uniref:LSM domain-containing protein n=1 Tax=Timema monikensis TaxID=170555 RepID=A0A7R9EDW9_9NEOP|nr:unnamed protein product [Timema monikensis]
MKLAPPIAELNDPAELKSNHYLFVRSTIRVDDHCHLATTRKVSFCGNKAIVSGLLETPNVPPGYNPMPFVPGVVPDTEEHCNATHRAVKVLTAEPVLAPRKQRPERNLLTRMRNTTTGPLARLRDCTELRVRVKVRTVLPPILGQNKIRIGTVLPPVVMGQNKVLPFVLGQSKGLSKVRTVLPPVRVRVKIRTESHHQSRVRARVRERYEQSLTTSPGSEQGMNRVLPPVLGQSQDKNRDRVLPPVLGQSKIRTDSHHQSRVRASPGSEQGMNRVLPPVLGQSQDKNRDRVLPPVLAQSKIRRVSPPVQGLSKSGTPGGRTSNRLTPTRGLRRQSRLDWLPETGMESRSVVVKVVFPFSLQDDEIKIYRPRSCIPEVVIQVYIRNMKGIRGYCIAFVAAFDKHWNLALEDVTEVWTRPVKRKAVALGETEIWTRPVRRKVVALVGPSPELQVQPSRVQVVKKDRRTETCERHVSQLMVRGEQVALIAILD